tara:strand:+ start:1169 stop:1651 length:483 start_codon:yes stop_codon:yes gene_type:complete
MKYIKISIGIFLALAASRFVPHPPNFTSLIALSFYIPALLGIRFLPALIICFALTDLFIGFHGTVLFTWGSIIFIGLISNKFVKNITSRISGALIGAFIFYIITNFGVWSLGFYGYSLKGLIECYTLAIPFFGYTLISTLVFSVIIETILKFKFIKILNS